MAFKLFDMDNDGRITLEEFSSLLRSALGVSDLNVSKLFKEINADNSGYISYAEFQTFAMRHPEYAKLFTTYMDLQRYQALQGEEEEQGPPSVSQVGPAPEDRQEESISDKKDDWLWELSHCVLVRWGEDIQLGLLHNEFSKLFKSDSRCWSSI